MFKSDFFQTRFVTRRIEVKEEDTEKEREREERAEQHVKAMDWHFSPVNIFYCSLTNAHRNHKKLKNYTILLHSHNIFMYVCTYVCSYIYTRAAADA